MSSDLMRKLVVVSTVVGVTFPAYPIWKREVEVRRAEQERRMKEMRTFFHAPPEPAVPPKASPAKARDDSRERKAAPFRRSEKEVGRNDSCPCGRGKKFKQCCMSRGKE